jgi:Na+-transporting NADH:ubiquinone oxidoreductase subunit NqrE
VLILFFVMFVGILVSLLWLLLFVLVNHTPELLVDVGTFLPFHVRCRDSFRMC